MFLNFLTKYRFAYLGSKTLKQKPFKYQHRERENRHYLPQNKWNELISSCSMKYRNIVKDILNPKLSINELKALNENIISIVDFNTKQSIKSYDLALITVALKNSKHHEIRVLKSKALDLFLYSSIKFTNHENFIAQNQNNLQKNGTQLNPALTEYLILQICEQYVNFCKNNKDKHKKSKMKLRLLNFLKDRGSYIQTVGGFSRLFNSMSQLTMDLNIINKFRLTDTVEMLQKKFRKILIENPNLTKHLNYKEQNSNKPSIQALFSLFKLLQYCQFDTTEAQKFYINMICSDDFYSPETYTKQKLRGYLMFYRLCFTFMDQNQKHPILQKIKQLLQKSTQSRKIFSQYQSIFKILFLINMFKAKFYSHYLKIPATIYQQHLVINELPPKPQIDEFQMQIFQSVIQELSKTQNSFYEMLTAVYPELVQGKKHVNKLPINKLQIFNITKGNQHSARLSFAVKDLNIPYKSQTKINGKKIDFLLEDDIILECDGDIHIDFKKMNVNMNTAWRNITLLYGGYRLIVINLHELNEHRSIGELKKLIYKKINIMKEQNAFLVE